MIKRTPRSKNHDELVTFVISRDLLSDAELRNRQDFPATNEEPLRNWTKPSRKGLLTGKKARVSHRTNHLQVSLYCI